MNIEIIDKKTLTKKSLIPVYRFSQYTDELTGNGKFKLILPSSESAVDDLVYDNFIFFEEGIVGIIKKVQESQDSDEELTVSGVLTNGVLGYRVIQKTTRFNGTLSDVCTRLLNTNFIEPVDSRRKVPLVRLQDTFPSSPLVAYCDTGTSVRESLAATLTPYGYGFEMYPIVTDIDESKGITTNLSALEFRLLQPVDRTINNEDGNDPVVFSFKFNNLARLNFEDDGSEYCSIAIVTSEGTGEQRKLIEVGDEISSGLDRKELYVDARDLQIEVFDDETGEINKITEEELEEMMEQRGLQKLQMYQRFVSVDGNILVNEDSMFHYGTDFYKGDFVSVIDELHNRIFDLQVISMTKSVSDGVEYTDVSFGLDKQTIRELMSKSEYSSSTQGSSGSGGGGGEGEKTEVSVSQAVTSGTKVASVIVDGEETDIYAPNPTSVTVTQSVTSGTKIAEIDVDGTKKSIFAPKDSSGSEALTALSGFSFGYTADGKPGYIEAGADTVIPFKTGESTEGYTMKQILSLLILDTAKLVRNTQMTMSVVVNNGTVNIQPTEG